MLLVRTRTDFKRKITSQNYEEASMSILTKERRDFKHFSNRLENFYRQSFFASSSFITIVNALACLSEPKTTKEWRRYV